MVITPSNLSTLFQGVSLAFQNAYLNMQPEALETLVQRLPCGTRDLRLPIVQSLSAAMTPWNGERQIQNMVLDGIVITPTKWTSTVGVSRDDISDDQYESFSNMIIPGVAAQAKALLGQLVAAEIQANKVGYDGVALYSASHPIDPSGQTTGVQSNLLSATPLNAANLAVARAAMANLKRPDGITPMGVVGQTLLVPPSLEFMAMTLANGAFYPTNTLSGSGSGAGSQSNPWQGAFKVVVSNRLTDTGNPATAVWYLCDSNYLGGAIKPFQYVERDAPEITSLVSPDNAIVFTTENFLFGARARAAASAQIWFLSMKVSGA